MDAVNRFSGLQYKEDGTGEKELLKAMSTYLNKTGAADYNLPKMTGEKIMVSNK